MRSCCSRTNLINPDTRPIGVGTLVAQVLVDQGSAVAIEIGGASAYGGAGNECTAGCNVGKHKNGGESSRKTSEHCELEQRRSAVDEKSLQDVRKSGDALILRSVGGLYIFLDRSVGFPIPLC